MIFGTIFLNIKLRLFQVSKKKKKMQDIVLEDFPLLLHLSHLNNYFKILYHHSYSSSSLDLNLPIFLRITNKM